MKKKVPRDSNQDLMDTSVGEDTVNLKERSIRGGTTTLTSQITMTGISLVSVVILARLLTPKDYGLIAMVTSITGFVNLFNEMGLSSATVQKRNITEEQINALFWINAGLGTLIMLIILALSPALAWFYGKSQLILVTMAFSLNSFIIGLGTQHGALLIKQMRFGTLAIVQISALVAGCVTAIAVALSGGAYWALVSSTLVTSALNTAGLWVTSNFHPSLPRRGKGVSQLLGFGANVAGFNIFNYFHRNMDNILIGRVWGAHQLGLYNKAYELVMLPIRNLRYPLNRVAFPAMSKIQNDPVRFRSYFIKYCSILAFLSMPFITFLFVCSENVIRLLLGDQWLGAAELFRILAIVGLIQPVTSLRQTVIMASGHAKRLFRWGIYNAIATVISFICGLPWGAKGVAIAYSLGSYLILHPSLMYAFKDTPVRTIDFYCSVAKPALASIVMAMLYMLAIGPLQQTSDIFILAISLPFCTITYLTVFYLLPGGRRSLIEYWTYLSILFRRPK